ncbi:hypothetical protein JCM9279_004733 [Rhodotorula babjevae]
MAASTTPGRPLGCSKRPRPPRSSRSRLVALLLAALSAPQLAQAASTSPALPTAILAPAVDPVGPELRRGASSAGGRLLARAPQAAVDASATTATTTLRATAASAGDATTRIIASSTAAGREDTAAATMASVLSSLFDDLGSAASTSLTATGSTTGAEDGRAATTTPTSTASSGISTSTAVPVGYKLPQAFDSTLGTNFSSTACPSFFATFLADPTFQSCAPFSLLLTTSSAFFKAQRSPLGLLPYVLNASCSAPEPECASTMATLARTIKLKNTCGPDLESGNPLATEALQGFQSYSLMREAGCARSNETSRYCFAEASAKKDPSDLYFYYLAEGTSLPSGTTPTCDFCTQNLLGIFSRYATNSTLALSRTYSSGRSAAALTCGPDFAPALAVQSKMSSASIAGGRASPVLVALALGSALVVLAVVGS